MQLNVLEQFKLYKQYQSIISDAERFFKSTAVFDNFKCQAFKAYQEGNLDDFQFTIDTLTILEASQDSPLYNQQVDLITEAPQFDNFVTLLSTISAPQQEADVTKVNATFTGAVNSSLQINEEQTIIQGQTYTPLDAATVFPQTNKIILDTNSLSDQSNKLISSGNGLITNPRAFTSIQLEQERQNVFAEELSTTQDESEAQDVIDKFTPDAPAPDTCPVEAIDTTIQEEYSGQVDPAIASEEILDIANTIREELKRLQGGQDEDLNAEQCAIPEVGPC